MAEIVRMPKLSDTMTEGVVAKWHKKVGDSIKTGELLADIETDKATMEFESFQEGVLLHIGVAEGQTAKVDSILAILGKKGEDIKALLEHEKEQAPTAKIEAPKPVSTPSKMEEKPKETPKVVAPIVTDTPSHIRISPLAKKLAQERNINIGHVKGSGDFGRIVKRDIDQHHTGFQPAMQIESFQDIPVSQMRKTIARRLSESKFSAPHFYLTMDIDMDELIKARNVINEISSVKISFNDLVIKAASASLQKHPAINSSWLNENIRYNKHIHIGVAIAVEEGLVVPVLRFANTKSLSAIASEVKSYAEKAKTKKLQPQDFTGNTFTISNLGMFGIDEFTAIINTPDACILAVGSIRQEPVVKNNQITIGNRMKVTLSCDHRVVDGATGAQFLQTLKKYLENPVLLLGEQMI